MPPRCRPYRGADELGPVQGGAPARAAHIGGARIGWLQLQYENRTSAEAPDRVGVLFDARPVCPKFAKHAQDQPLGSAP